MAGFSHPSESSSPSGFPEPSGPSNPADLSALLRQAAEESGGGLLYGTIFLAAPQEGGGLFVAADGRRLRAEEGSAGALGGLARAARALAMGMDASQFRLALSSGAVDSSPDEIGISVFERAAKLRMLLREAHRFGGAAARGDLLRAEWPAAGRGAVSAEPDEGIPLVLASGDRPPLSGPSAEAALREAEALFDSLRPHGATAVRIAWRWEESSSLEILDAAVAGLQP